MPAQLLTERVGNSLVLTLSDLDTRNTLSHALLAADTRAPNIAEGDAKIRCLPMRSAGAHFCSGGNLHGLRERRRAGPPAQLEMLEHLHEFVEALRTCPKPVIAAVEGAAAGAGFSLALGCDLIAAAQDARFVFSHGRIGLSPDGGTTWALGEPITAQQLVG